MSKNFVEKLQNMGDILADPTKLVERVLAESSQETKELLTSIKPMLTFVCGLFGVDPKILTATGLEGEEAELQKDLQKKTGDAVRFLSDTTENVSDYQTKPKTHENLVDEQIGGKSNLVVIPESLKGQLNGGLKGKKVTCVLHFHGAIKTGKEVYFKRMEELLAKDDLPGITVCPHHIYSLQGDALLQYIEDLKTFFKEDPRFGCELDLQFSGHSLAGAVLGGNNFADASIFKYMEEHEVGAYFLDPVVNNQTREQFAKIIEHNKTQPNKIPLGVLWGYVQGTQGTYDNMVQLLNSGVLPEDGAKITRDAAGKIISYHNPSLRITIESLADKKSEFKTHRLAIAGLNYLVSKTIGDAPNDAQADVRVA